MKRIVTKGKSHNQIVKVTTAVLRAGGLVVFPTDTVYGLLADASNAHAVSKLTEFKNRPAGKPISIFVSGFSMMRRFVEVSKKSESRLKEMLPGPFTIILPSKHTVSTQLEAENGTLGVRIPDNELIKKLVAAYGKPVTATSANLSGKSACHSVDALLNQLSGKEQKMIDLIVDAGQLPKNKPSTVVDLTGESLKILREGGYDRSKLSQSENQTRHIAKDLLRKYTAEVKDKPLVFIIKGDLGAGKTIFVKGIGEELGIKNIISPTFVVYYEYDVTKPPVKKLVHYDLYRLQESNEFAHLGIEEYLTPGNILCFEWGEKSAVIFDELKKKARVVMVSITYTDETHRKINSNKTI